MFGTSDPILSLRTRPWAAAHARSRRAGQAALSLVAWLAGVLSMLSAASAQPAVQVASAGLGPTISHAEMAERVGPGLAEFFAALASINPTAGPVTGTPLGNRTMASDTGKGSGGGVQYLCPDRPYKSDAFVNNEVYAGCSNGTVNVVLLNDIPSLSFVKFTSDPLPPSVPPDGPPTPLPCGAVGFVTSMSSNLSSLRTVVNSGH